MRKLSALGGLLILSATVTGCGTIRDLGQSVGIGREDPAEERAERLRVPPDLSSERIQDSMPLPAQPGEATYSAYAQGARSDVLPNPEQGVRVQKAGGLRWLEVDAPAEQVWNWVVGYLNSQGVDVERKNPQLGIVQTEWLLHGAAVPRGVFAPQVKEEDDARVADFYQFRLEHGAEASTAEVYVAHRRMARSKLPDSSSLTEWQPRPSDPYLEAEMLRGLMLYLGVQEPFAIQRVAQAEGGKRQAQLEQNAAGEPQLVLPESFYRAWRRVGVALDRLGFSLEDRDRADGKYYVRYDVRAETGKREKGLLESMAFWRKDDPDSLQQYVVRVNQTDGRSVVTVETEAGEPVPAEVAAQILGLLEEQLR